jgi:hypothetical protein
MFFCPTEFTSNNRLQEPDPYSDRRRVQVDVCMQKRSTRTVMEDFNTD